MPPGISAMLPFIPSPFLLPNPTPPIFSSIQVSKVDLFGGWITSQLPLPGQEILPFRGTNPLFKLELSWTWILASSALFPPLLALGAVWLSAVVRSIVTSTELTLTKVHNKENQFPVFSLGPNSSCCRC